MADILKDILDEPTVRKNYNLHQSLIDEAKEVLGVDTETEAIETALALTSFGHRLARGTAEMLGETHHDGLGLGGAE